MDHLLLWVVIALVVLVLGAIWQWLRKLELRSRRRKGNNYLYQEYNYDHDTDHRAIDLAWESYQDDIQTHQSVEASLELELDSEELNTEEETRDEPWKDYQNHLSLHQAIEEYLDLESDGEPEEEKSDSQHDYLPLSLKHTSGQEYSPEIRERNNHNIQSAHENSEVRDDY